MVLGLGVDAQLEGLGADRLEVAGATRRVLSPPFGLFTLMMPGRMERTPIIMFTVLQYVRKSPHAF